MTGTLQYDSDETEPEKIRDDFINATEEGFDFMRYGDVDDFQVNDIDGAHVHLWIKSYFGDEEYCAAGCHCRRELTAK